MNEPEIPYFPRLSVIQAVILSLTQAVRTFEKGGGIIARSSHPFSNLDPCEAMLQAYPAKCSLLPSVKNNFTCYGFIPPTCSTLVHAYLAIIRLQFMLSTWYKVKLETGFHIAYFSIFFGALYQWIWIFNAQKQFQLHLRVLVTHPSRLLDRWTLHEQLFHSIQD